jgi:hypothetical protein
MTRKSTQLIEEIAKIMETTDIMGTASSNLWIRRRRGLPITLMMQRSGARSIAPQDIICKSVKLFWIVRRYHQQ